MEIPKDNVIDTTYRFWFIALKFDGLFCIAGAIIDPPRVWGVNFFWVFLIFLGGIIFLFL